QISHNFRKEVNNCRVHVYRCDGPCRFRRPSFGIVRRAVNRPPGPTEGWWERHKRECGGTFKKIEGSAIPNLIAQQPISSNLANSVSKHATNIPSRTTKPVFKPSQSTFKQLKPIIPKSKPINITKKNPNTFEKKNRINRIKSNVASVKSVNKNEIPVIQIDDSVEKDVYEFSNYPLDGIMETYSNQIGKNSDQKEKYSNQKKSILIDVNDVPHIAKGSTLVAGDINLQYISKNPKIINITKYLEKISKNIVNANPETGSNGFLNLNKMENILVNGNINFNYETKFNLNINKYLIKYKKSIGLTGTIDKNPNITLNIEVNVDNHNDFDNDDNTKMHKSNSPERSSFVNNNIKAQQDSMIESMNNKDMISHDKWIDFGQIMICPNCDNEILEAEFKDHLSYCIDSEDEGGSENEGVSENEETESDHDDLCPPAIPPGVIGCPACMEHVKEEDIQQHMEVCLEGMAEELW
ncbi:unnamed protein product, partial [Meganyctiphanes norvegica]